MEIIVSKDAKTLTVDGVDYNLTYKPSGSGILIYIYASRTVYDKHTVGFWLFKKEITRKRIEYPPKVLWANLHTSPGEIASVLESSFRGYVKNNTLAERIQNDLDSHIEGKVNRDNKAEELSDLLNQLNGSGSIKDKIEKELGL